MFSTNKAVLVSCSNIVSKSELTKTIKTTRKFSIVTGYVIGMSLILKYGLPLTTKLIRKLTNKKIIVDYQSAGFSDPKNAEFFASICKDSGVHAVILFPLAGVLAEKKWIDACKKYDINIIIGGEMDHKGFLCAEGGHIDSGAPLHIIGNAIQAGIRDFIIPGTQPEKLKQYQLFLDGFRDSIGDSFKYIFYSNGFITNEGELTESGILAKDAWCFILENNNPVSIIEKIESLRNVSYGKV